MSFKDTQSYGASYIFTTEKQSGKEFTKGHKIHYEANYYIYLVDGEVLNGGKNIQSVDVVIK